MIHLPFLMEDCTDKRKRVNVDDSEPDSPESKARRVDSGSSAELVRVDSGVDSSESQLTQVDSGESCFNSDESVFDSGSARDLQDDILNILEDTENVAERDSAMQGLDSVIKSFEEEILAAGSDSGQNPEHDLQPNLGYLLEASDDELGLPPSTVAEPDNVEPGRVEPEGVDLTGFMGFEDDIPNYDVFGFGTGLTGKCGGDDDGGAGAGGFDVADGLFEYSEPSDILWRSESLHAM